MQNIIFIHSKKFFLSLVYEHVKKVIDNKRFDGEIIFPNGVLCTEFRSLVEIQYLKYIEILSIDKILLKSNSINSFEERLLIAQIIKSFPFQKCNFIEALRMSSEISNLLYKMEIDNVQIKDLEICAQNLYNIDYWDRIYEFLQYVYKEFYQYLQEHSLISRAREQILSYEKKIDQLINQNKDAILITSLSDDFYYKKFLQDLLILKNSYLIFSPFPKNFVYTDSLNDPLSKIYSLLNKLSIKKDINRSSISNIEITDEDLLTKIFSMHNSSRIFNSIPEFRIYFQEFTTALEEYRFVVSEIKKILKRKDRISSKIAIITKNTQAKDFFTSQFDALGLHYHDFIGINISESDVIKFLILISDFIYNKFSVQNFINLLSHKFLLDDKLGILIDNFSNFSVFTINSLESLEQIIEDCLLYENKDDFLPWIKRIIQILKNHKKSLNLKDIISALCTTAEALYHNLWSSLSNYNLKETLLFVLKTKINIKIDICDISKLIKDLFQGYRIHKSTSDTKLDIFIVRPEESGLINFDYVFFIEFNESNYSSSYRGNHYLNLHAQKMLGIDLGYQQISKESYNISMNLINSCVFATYSKKNFLGMQVSEAYFIKKLSYFFPQNFFSLNFQYQYVDCAKPLLNAQFAEADYFPSKISAKDLELLIKAPYNFYVKKILGLRKKRDSLYDEFKPDVFGNLIHKAIYNYSLYRNFNSDNSYIKKNMFQNIIHDVVGQIFIGEYSKKIYLHRMLSMVDEFIEFDEVRRSKNFVKICSEIHGNIRVKINDIHVYLVAIADRIEIEPSGIGVILDFKTGSIPSKKNINLGLYPQLVLESLILLEGGFVNVICKDIHSLIYVKINSHSPYFTLQEFHITKEDLLFHKESIIKLLKHYIDNKKYYSEVNMMPYDDYSHISRRYEQDFNIFEYHDSP